MKCNECNDKATNALKSIQMNNVDSEAGNKNTKSLH